MMSPLVHIGRLFPSKHSKIEPYYKLHKTYTLQNAIEVSEMSQETYTIYYQIQKLNTWSWNTVNISKECTSYWNGPGHKYILSFTTFERMMINR